MSSQYGCRIAPTCFVILTIIGMFTVLVHSQYATASAAPSSLQGIIGIRNTVTFNSITVTSQGGSISSCPDNLINSNCFAIQQNYFIVTPASYAAGGALSAAYWAQNILMVDKDLSGWRARANFEIFDNQCTSSCPPLVNTSPGAFVHFTLPLPSPWTLTSQLDPGSGVLTMTNDFYTTGFTYNIPSGSAIGVRETTPELAMVGDATNCPLNQCLTPRNAVFSDPTSGSIQSSLLLAGISGWQAPSTIKIKTCPSGSCTTSAETSQNLQFSVSGPSASFCALSSSCPSTSSDLQQGIAFPPGSPQAQIIQPLQYPSSIGLGQVATITVKAKNTGYVARWMTISIIFPTLTDPSAVLTANSDVPCSDGSQANCVFAPNSIVSKNYGAGTATLSYVMVEVTKMAWVAGESHSLTVFVKPSATGPFKFRVKSVAASYVYVGQPDQGSSDPSSFSAANVCMDSSTSISVPHCDTPGVQNEWVYDYMIQVTNQYSLLVQSTPNSNVPIPYTGTYSGTGNTQFTIGPYTSAFSESLTAPGSDGAGGTFAYWLVNNVNQGSTNPVTVNVGASNPNPSAIAIYQSPGQYVLHVSSVPVSNIQIQYSKDGSNFASGNTPFDVPSSSTPYTATLRAPQNPSGYTFSYWTVYYTGGSYQDNGACSSGQCTASVQLTTNYPEKSAVATYSTGGYTTTITQFVPSTIVTTSNLWSVTTRVSTLVSGVTVEQYTTVTATTQVVTIPQGTSTTVAFSTYHSTATSTSYVTSTSTVGANPSVVQNGDFSNGLSGWSVVGAGNPGYPYVGTKQDSRYSGGTFLYFDVLSGNPYVDQSVTLPTAQLTLSLLTWGNYDPVTATITIVDSSGGTHIIETFTPTPEDSFPIVQPVLKSYDISSYGGQTVHLRIGVTHSGSGSGTIANFDNIAITQTSGSSAIPFVIVDAGLLSLARTVLLMLGISTSVLLTLQRRLAGGRGIGVWGRVWSGLSGLKRIRVRLMLPIILLFVVVVFGFLVLSSFGPVSVRGMNYDMWISTTDRASDNAWSNRGSFYMNGIVGGSQNYPYTTPLHSSQMPYQLYANDAYITYNGIRYDFDHWEWDGTISVACQTCQFTSMSATGSGHSFAGNLAAIYVSHTLIVQQTTYVGSTVLVTSWLTQSSTTTSYSVATSFSTIPTTSYTFTTATAPTVVTSTSTVTSVDSTSLLTLTVTQPLVVVTSTIPTQTTVVQPATTVTSSTSYTSTSTSTSTIPTVTTVVLVPQTVTSTDLSTKLLTSLATTTATSYTGTQTSTSTMVVPVTVTAPVMSTVLSTVISGSTVLVPSTTTTTMSSYTGTSTSTGTVTLLFTVTAPVTSTVTLTTSSGAVVLQSATSTLTTSSYTGSSTSTRTILVLVTVTAPVTRTVTLTTSFGSTVLVSRSTTGTLTSYTSTATQTSGTVVYVTVTSSAGSSSSASTPSAGAPGSAAFFGWLIGLFGVGILLPGFSVKIKWDESGGE